MKNKNSFRAFHLDMKVSHYRPDYLHRLFPRLKKAGYTHVMFDVEDKVRFDCTRGAEWFEAYTKTEFDGILADARAAGLEPFPLIPTLGHMEWLLSHARYHPLREEEKSAMMLCPSKLESIDFLHRYIDEVLELFRRPEFIHIGLDEAYQLGTCPVCRERAERTSRSNLLIEHANELVRYAARRGSRPMAWADMVLQYPEALSNTCRDLIWIDWDYRCGDGPSETISWPYHGVFKSGDPLPGDFTKGVGRFAVDEKGRFRPWCYADYLADQGFDVVIAPALRCMGDPCFAPEFSHLPNCVGALTRLRREPRIMGTVVTTWAVRLNHIETQWPGIVLPAVMDKHPETRWADLETPISEEVFGRPCREFFRAWEKIAVRLPNVMSFTMFEFHSHYYGPGDTFMEYLSAMRAKGFLKETESRLDAIRDGFREGASILERVPGKNKNPDCLGFWRYAAGAMQMKADELALTLRTLDGHPDPAEAARLLMATESLRDEYRNLLSDSYTPASVERELMMIFGSSIRLLAHLANQSEPCMIIM